MNPLILIRQYILKIAEPFLKCMGHIYIGRAGINFDDDFKELRDGDVIVTRRNWVLSNLFIDGYWKHAGIVKIEKNHIFIIEALTKTGVSKTPLEKFLSTKSEIRALRSLFADTEKCSESANVAVSLIGKPYDFGILSGNNAFYCSEVIWYAYEQVLKPSPFTPRLTLGVETVTPNDLALATKKWETIFSKSRNA